MRLGASGSTASLSGIIRAGLIAIVAAVAANLMALAIVRAVTDLPTEFLPLQYPPIAIFTALGVALGAVVFAIVSRVSRQPVRTFWIVAMVALLVSLIPNAMFAINPVAAPAPGGSALAYGVLMIFHVIAAFVCVPILTSVGRR